MIVLDNLLAPLAAGWIQTAGLWLLTYLVHSTVLLGGVWLLAARGAIRSDPVAEILWKGALVGGIVTATIQVSGTVVPLGGRIPLPIPVMDTERESPAASDRFDAGGAPAIGPERIADERPETRHPALSDSDPAVAGPGRIDCRASSPTSGTDAMKPVATIGALGGGEGERLSGGSRRNGGFHAPMLCGAAVLLTGALLFGLARLKLRSRLSRRRVIASGPLRAMLDRLCRENGVGRTIRLTTAPGAHVPIAFGVFRPEICIPRRALSDLSPDEQRVMLAHELAHVVRRDPAWLALAYVVSRLLFLQPLNRIALRHIREISEFASDAWAAGHGGGRISLARCLTEVAGWVLAPVGGSAPVSAGMAGSASILTQRVERLLKEKEGDRSRRTSIGGFTILAVLLAGVTLGLPGLSAGALGADRSDRTKRPPAAGARELLEEGVAALAKENGALAAEIEALSRDIRRAGLDREGQEIIERLHTRLRGVTIRTDRLEAAAAGYSRIKKPNEDID